MLAAKALAQRLTRHTLPISLSYRYIRARWERGYLKDLYHRRVLMGADPVMHRSAYPNWDYRAEIFAFGHRIGSPETSGESLIRSLTDPSYFDRADVRAESSGASPSKDADPAAGTRHNAELVVQGDNLLRLVVCAYLRYSLPLAPEELIVAVAQTLLEQEQLARIGTHLGVNVLVHTVEFPPSEASITNSFKALLATLTQKSARALILNVVIPYLLDVDFVEAFSLANPLGVLRTIMRRKGAENVEPRIMRSAGEISAEPIFVVGIYADRKLLGQSPGESLAIAIDLAARVSLLREWGIADDLCFPLGERAHRLDLSQHTSPNYSLKERYGPDIDLTLVRPSDESPINVVETAQRYLKEIRPVVGQPLKRRLRHFFSRGSLAKRSFRYLVKPKPHTVS